MPYSTKQRQAVLACLARRREEPVSALELAEELRAGGERVGLATVYRQLEKLERTGCVHKVNTEEGALYRYCSRAEQGACFLLKCEGCGRIVHLDCAQLRPFYRHLEQEHGFRIDPRSTVLAGLCDVCAAGADAPRKPDGRGEIGERARDASPEEEETPWKR